MRQRAEHPADRVAELAVGIDVGLQDLRADPQVLGVVGGDHPEPQDVGAGLLDHLLRRHLVAERLRHLAAVLGHDEAVRQHRVIGRAAARAAAFEKRGMEPAAMLVGAFEIKRSRPFQVRPLLQHEGVGRAGIEPDVEDVVDLLPFRRIEGIAEKRSLAPSANQASAPSSAEGRDDAGVDRLVLQDLAGLAVRRRRRSARPRRAGARPPSRGGSRSCRAGGSGRRADRSACRRSPSARGRAACRRRRQGRGPCG